MDDRAATLGQVDETPIGELLGPVMNRDPREWRSALDQRHGVLNDVLAGRRAAVIYPAARMGRAAAPLLRSMGARVVALGDRDPTLQGSTIDGLPVVSPSEIATRHRSDAILVASTMYDSAICEDLASRGCDSVVPVGYLNLRLPEVFRSREYEGAWNAVTNPTNRAEIEAAGSLLSDAESRRVFAGKLAYYLSLDKHRLDTIRSAASIYFDRSVYGLGTDEIFVDGGAYVGDTLTEFLEQSANRFHGYFAFEPDPASFARLTTVAAFDPSRIVAVMAGLAGRTSSGRFLSTQGADSRMLRDEEPGGGAVPVVSLDEYFRGRRPPSIIKLDVEGAEAAALQGAAGLIESAAPVLAISAYHFPTDLWTIPLLMSRLMPSSRLYLRHYTREVDDTVCYAIPTERRDGRSAQ